MSFDEQAITFPCAISWLHGIASMPSVPASRGVLILVGGPQYRTGSHRQFTLLARDLATSGIPAFRFDYRGMGDSEGSMRTFEDIEDDVRAAIDAFTSVMPSLNEVVIWGLCDAAAAALFYAYRDPRITGLILLNPWVRTQQGIARTYLKHYYWARLFTPDFWRKIGNGSFSYVEAGRSLLTQIRSVFLDRPQTVDECSASIDGTSAPLKPLPERIYDGLVRFQGQVLVILSEKDLTAQEFSELANGSRKWKKLFASPRINSYNLPGSNHTFSRREWREQVSAWTREWIRTW